MTTGHDERQQEKYRASLGLTYQMNRAATLATAVGLARLALRNGDSDRALEALDEAAVATRELLNQFLRDFNTPPLSLPVREPGHEQR